MNWYTDRVTECTSVFDKWHYKTAHSRLLFLTLLNLFQFDISIRKFNRKKLISSFEFGNGTLCLYWQCWWYYWISKYFWYVQSNEFTSEPIAFWNKRLQSIGSTCRAVWTSSDCSPFFSFQFLSNCVKSIGEENLANCIVKNSWNW